MTNTGSPRAKVRYGARTPGFGPWSQRCCAGDGKGDGGLHLGSLCGQDRCSGQRMTCAWRLATVSGTNGGVEPACGPGNVAGTWQGKPSLSRVGVRQKNKPRQKKVAQQGATPVNKSDGRISKGTIPYLNN